MPGPRKQPKRMGRKAARGAKAFGKAVTTGRAINPFVSAALKAAKGLKSAKGRSNNQHL